MCLLFITASVDVSSRMFAYYHASSVILCDSRCVFASRMVKPTNVIFMGGLQTLSGWPTSIGARAIQRLALVGRADPRCPRNGIQLTAFCSDACVGEVRVAHVNRPCRPRYPLVRIMLTFSAAAMMQWCSRCAFNSSQGRGSV